MASSRHALVQGVRNASHQFEQLGLGSTEIIDAAASSPSESEQPPVRRKRTRGQNQSQTRTSQLSMQGSLPANPPEQVRKVPGHALAHAVLEVTVLLDEERVFKYPTLISAYECTSARKLTPKIKEAYGRNGSNFRVFNERAFAKWFHELGLYAADSPNKCFPAAEIAVVLETTEEVQNCFFTDGNIEVSHDRAAMNEALGIGQEDGDSTVNCSRRYLKGLEQAEEVKEAAIEVKNKEIESLRGQLRRKEAEVKRLRSLVESEEVEEQPAQSARMPVGGLSLPR